MIGTVNSSTSTSTTAVERRAGGGGGEKHILLQNKSRQRKGRLADASYVKAYKTPTFTLKEVRDQVPEHLFKRNTFRSLSHLLMDLIWVIILAYSASKIDVVANLLSEAGFPSTYFSLLAWPVYWVAQGCILTGVWVLAHECGHSAFSPHSIVNNTVGFILHSALLVPFFSWKYTHSKHHKGTNHLLKDQVFVPPTRSRFMKSMKLQDDEQAYHEGGEDSHSLYEEAPLYNMLRLVRMLIFGWPMYLLFNKTSQKHKGWVNHFNPSAPIFGDRERPQVSLSNIGLVVTICALYWSTVTFGGLNVLFYYGIPYLNVNFWLVLITYLQHTDPIVPKYRGNTEWNFMLGALATIDRDFGFLLNRCFHHITDTHVVHHLFSTLPFYNAVEATKAVKPFLGQYYLEDKTHWFKAALRVTETCRFVEDEGDRVWYKG